MSSTTGPVTRVPAAPAHGSPVPRWRRAGRWIRVGLLACLPFAIGMLVGLATPATLSPSLPPLVAGAVLILGVPLWFLVAEALAAGLRQAISHRRTFLAVDAVCGLGLLMLLYSLLVTPWWGALTCALAAAATWCAVAKRTHAALRATKAAAR